MIQPIQRRQHPTTLDQPQNVGEVDRWISGVFGTGLLLSGLRSRGLWGLLKSGIGGAMVYRSMTGHCPMQHQIDIDRGRARAEHSGPPAPAETIAGAHKKPYNVRPPSKEGPDTVQEASEESFPASDAPAWGPGPDRM